MAEIENNNRNPYLPRQCLKLDMKYPTHALGLPSELHYYNQEQIHYVGPRLCDVQRSSGGAGVLD